MTNLEIVGRLALSLVLGGVIGLERQTRHRPAGFRTHILVCMGAAIVMILSELMFRKYYLEFDIISDPARLGAQVISGVGFLGAGTIIHYGSNIKGLTTAASLWAVATIGLVCGSGFYFLAVVSTVGIYFILLIFSNLYRKIQMRTDVNNLIIEVVNNPKTIGAIYLILSKNNIKIMDMNSFHLYGDDDIESDKEEIVYLELLIKVSDDVPINNLVEMIEKLNDVKKVNLA